MADGNREVFCVSIDKSWLTLVNLNAPPSDLHQRNFGEDPICGAVSYQTDSDTPDVQSRRKISCTSMRVAYLFLRISKNMNS